MEATDNIQLLAAFRSAGADADSESKDLYSFSIYQSDWSRQDAVIHAMQNYNTTSNSTAFRNTGGEADVDP